MLKKLKHSVYKLIKEEGRQTHRNDVFEYFISALILLNIVLLILASVNSFYDKYHLLIDVLHTIFFIVFLVEYILRVWISDIVLHDTRHPIYSRLRFVFSFRSIIDLLALMPTIIGSTVIDFRIFRVLRLFRIAQLKVLNQYTNILKKVLHLKGMQLFSSMIILIIFTITSAIVIYDLENPAQPEVYDNILTSIWWSISTITTVGYGDIYPITAAGRAVGSCISIIGVLIVAVPVGILSAGFFEVSKSLDTLD